MQVKWRFLSDTQKLGDFMPNSPALQKILKEVLMAEVKIILATRTKFGSVGRNDVFGSIQPPEMVASWINTEQFV